MNTQSIHTNGVDGIWLQSDAKDLTTPQPLLILLHGYGADMHDLAGLAPYLSHTPNIVCFQGTHATPFGGRQWFDIQYQPDGNLRFDENQALQSGHRMTDTISQFLSVHAGEFSKVILGGFSQGAGVTMLVTLPQPKQLDGFMLLSGKQPAHIEKLIDDEEALSHLSLFIGHGTLDPVLPIQNGRDLHEFWKKQPVSLTYHEYPMGHEICNAELNDMNVWLNDVVGGESR